MFLHGGEGGIPSPPAFAAHKWVPPQASSKAGRIRIMPPGIILYVGFESDPNAANQNTPRVRGISSGGEGGIRTLGTVSRTHDFESSPFDHSGTSPNFYHA